MRTRDYLLSTTFAVTFLLLPGAFLLAGAAAMCIFGALVEFTLIPWTMWVLLISGALLWTAAMVLVRSHSH